MKVGVVGVGYWGIKHVEEYSALNVNMSICDLNKERLELCKKKFRKVKQVTLDYNDILSDDTIKAVSICTPNETHYKICKDFLNADKHVLLEKPMTLSYKQAKKLVEIANEKNLVLMVGHIYRFNNAIRKIRELVVKNYFGNIYTIKLTWTNLEPVFDRDILFDLAVHPFDIINFIFGKNPKIVFCMAKPFRKRKGEEIAFINGKLNKAIVAIELSWLTPKKVRELVLVGSKASAFVECVKQEVKIYQNETNEMKTLNIKPNNTIRTELKHFLERVNNRKKSIASGEIGAEIIRLVEETRNVMVR
jgi:predicted dehydrogenase